MKTGICTTVDLEMGFDELAALIADAGFSHISLSHNVSHSGYHLPGRPLEIKRHLDGLGLGLNYIHAPISGYLDLTSPVETVRRASIETVKMPLHACAEIGGSCVVTHPCNFVDLADGSLTGRVSCGTESYLELIEYSNSLGVCVAMENMPSDTGDQRVMEALFEQPELGALNLCIDTCHAWINNPDPVELVRRMAPRVIATHISDTQGGDDSHLVPGEGVVDFDVVTGELARAGYQGVVNLESSVHMLRRRTRKSKLHPNDPEPVDTKTYLDRCHAAAVGLAARIVGSIEGNGVANQ